MSAVMSEWPRLHRITVDEYHRMGEVGLFAPDARVELIQGEVFDMSPIGSAHGGKTARLVRLFQQAIGDQGLVWISSIRLGDDSEPQPDLTVLKMRQDFYERAHPGPNDILLVLEVSDSTLPFDRTRKLALYAEHRIPEYWIVDLKNSQLMVFREPRAGAYGEVSSIGKPGVMSFAALPGVTVDLSGFFPVA